jgi:peptidoglycan/LPS O-acetylase OafA/YrhL
MKLLLSLVAILIPLSMVFFGWAVGKYPPSRNNAYGYRTKRSMRNDEAWDFAQQCFARLWRRQGLIQLSVTAVALVLLAYFASGTATYYYLYEALIGANAAAMLVVILCTERKLKERFGA